mmetsp:Transcript_12465/g.34706  ORF Transcript_12465/g.34706 Transcript_12465/m.34706 type:complete len:487 (-) Transcript_12465:144-1604(-)
MIKGMDWLGGDTGGHGCRDCRSFAQGCLGFPFSQSGDSASDDVHVLVRAGRLDQGLGFAVDDVELVLPLDVLLVLLQFSEAGGEAAPIFLVILRPDVRLSVLGHDEEEGLVGAPGHVPHVRQGSVVVPREHAHQLQRLQVPGRDVVLGPVPAGGDDVLAVPGEADPTEGGPGGALHAVREGRDGLARELGLPSLGPVLRAPWAPFDQLQHPDETLRCFALAVQRHEVVAHVGRETEEPVAVLDHGGLAHHHGKVVALRLDHLHLPLSVPQDDHLPPPDEVRDDGVSDDGSGRRRGASAPRSSSRTRSSSGGVAWPLLHEARPDLPPLEGHDGRGGLPPHRESVQLRVGPLVRRQEARAVRVDPREGAGLFQLDGPSRPPRLQVVHHDPLVLRVATREHPLASLVHAHARDGCLVQLSAVLRQTPRLEVKDQQVPFHGSRGQDRPIGVEPHATQPLPLHLQNVLQNARVPQRLFWIKHKHVHDGWFD